MKRKSQMAKLLNREKNASACSQQAIAKVCRNGFFLRSDAYTLRNRLMIKQKSYGWRIDT
ncbi:hypothetical protein D9754_17890 [Planomicrobium sp. Y74]|nr:hypothetical protein D9754_17890 [Planomicrobium sp. Y74]